MAYLVRTSGAPDRTYLPLLYSYPGGVQHDYRRTGDLTQSYVSELTSYTATLSQSETA